MSKGPNIQTTNLVQTCRISGEMRTFRNEKATKPVYTG